VATLSLVLLRWNEFQERLESVWKNRWCGVVLTAVIGAVMTYLFYSVPAPGVSVAFMGGAAAIMAARIEPTGAEKAAWMVIISGFLVIEISAINNERFLARVHEGQRVAEEQRKFAELRNDIRDAATKTTHQLDATMVKENEVLGKTQQVAGLAKQSLENMTGGESFAIVTPQVWSALVPIPLTIRNYGKQTLTGVTVTIRDPAAWDFFNHPYSMYQAQASALSVGTLHAGEIKTLTRAITPSTEGNGAGILGEGENKVVQYQLDISAQNFTVTEYLTFKKGQHVPWDFRYLVELQYVKSKTPNETKFGYKKLAETDWRGE